jgi:predicted nucleotidyltransferase
MPRSDTKQPASGRFVIRIDPGLHGRIRAAARGEGLSLNEYCARRLAAPAGDVACPSGLRDAVERAFRTFGRDLVGVAAFGSWTRGETAAGSDVDLLIVLEARVRLTRALYRACDEVPLSFEGRPIDVHLGHLPPEEETVAGAWAEVAIDGVVLFDTALRLSRRLVRIRHDIVSGRLVRRTAHGQPYWIEAEAA